MSKFKLIGRCAACKRRRWFVGPVTLKLPLGALTATSRANLCPRHRRQAKALYSQK